MRSLFIGILPVLLALPNPAAAKMAACDPVSGRIVTASWYGPGHHGHPTASGEIFDRGALTAAHPCLPFGTILAVEDVATGRVVEVRINDRGPFRPGRQIDLSEAAAQRLGLSRRGLSQVRLRPAAAANPICPAQRPCAGGPAIPARR